MSSGWVKQKTDVCRKSRDICWSEPEGFWEVLTGPILAWWPCRYLNWLGYWIHPIKILKKVPPKVSLGIKAELCVAMLPRVREVRNLAWLELLVSHMSEVEAGWEGWAWGLSVFWRQKECGRFILISCKCCIGGVTWRSSLWVHMGLTSLQGTLWPKVLFQRTNVWPEAIRNQLCVPFGAAGQHSVTKCLQWLWGLYVPHTGDLTAYYCRYYIHTQRDRNHKFLPFIHSWNTHRSLLISLRTHVSPSLLMECSVAFSEGPFPGAWVDSSGQVLSCSYLWMNYSSGQASSESRGRGVCTEQEALSSWGPCLSSILCHRSTFCGPESQQGEAPELFLRNH